MTVKAVIGFDHYPKLSGTWTPLADHGMLAYGGQQISSDGWAGSTSWTSTSRIGYSLVPFLAEPVAKIWCGVRVRFDVASNTTKPLVGLVIGSLTSSVTSSILSSTEVRTVTGLTTIPAGTTGYFEFSIDIATGIVDRRYNGIALASVAISANDRRWILYLEMTTGSNTSNSAFRDIYINDDQGGISGFLGAQIAKRIQFDSATASGWTTSPTTGVDLIYGLDLLDSTKDISDVNKTPLVASLRPDLPTGVTASAIELTVALSSTIANVVNCGMKLKNGTDESAEAVVSGPANNVINYNGQVGLFPTAPGGHPWTNAVIDVTDVILTPDI